MSASPDATTLITAIDNWMQKRDTSDPSISYYNRVASNALTLVARELRHSAVFSEIESTLRASVRDGAYESEAALCRAIALGELSLDDPDLHRYLRVTTRLQLAIDNPRYSAIGRQPIKDVEAEFREAKSDTNP